MSCGKVFVAIRYHQIVIMKKIVYLLLSATLFAASCKKDKDPVVTPTPTPETPTAKVKFVNGCVNATGLSVELNDTALSSVSSLNFLSITDYVKTSYGNSMKIAFVYSGSGTDLLSVNSDLSQNSNYSVYLGGEVPTNFDMLVVSDNVTAPASGKARVRFVNLSADTRSMNLFIGGTMLDSTITYSEYTSQIEINSGIVDVLVQDDNNGGYFKTLNGQNFESGKIYTITYTGKDGASGDYAPKLTLLNNN